MKKISDAEVGDHVIVVLNHIEKFVDALILTRKIGGLVHGVVAESFADQYGPGLVSDLLRQAGAKKVFLDAGIFLNPSKTLIGREVTHAKELYEALAKAMYKVRLELQAKEES